MPKMKNQETKNIVVRKLKEEDLEAVSALSLKCFGPENGLKMEHLQSQLELFPEGQICATLDGKVVGAAMSVRVKFEDYGYDHNYYDVSDHGYIRNHNPEGQDLYGIEVAVDADYRGNVGVILANFSDTPFMINPGDRIAQAVLNKFEKIEWKEVSTLDETERGTGGFGHSGI